MKLPAFKKPIIKHCIKILAILINIKYNNKEYTEQNYSLVISSTYKKISNNALIHIEIMSVYY